MHFADKPAVHSETHVKASPEEVWEFVTDITLPAELSEELQSVEWLDGATEPALGARFLGRNRHQEGNEWQTVSHVVALEPARRFGWAVLPEASSDGPHADTSKAVATWWFALEPQDGGTLLRQSMQVEPGPSGLTEMLAQHPGREEEMLRLRLEQLRAGMEANLQGIKARAEADRSTR